MSDSLENFASSTIAVGPSPATSGTTLTLESGPPSPTPPYDLTCWPPNTQPTYANAEIVRVLAQTGNVVTSMTRNPYQSSPQPIVAGWNAAQNLTSAMLGQLGGGLTIDSFPTFNASGNTWGSVPGGVSVWVTSYCTSVPSIAGGVNFSVASVPSLCPPGLVFMDIVTL